jgi:hypothetical protein
MERRGFHFHEWGEPWLLGRRIDARQAAVTLILVRVRFRRGRPSSETLPAFDTNLNGERGAFGMLKLFPSYHGNYGHDRDGNSYADSNFFRFG